MKKTCVHNLWRSTNRAFVLKEIPFFSSQPAELFVCLRGSFFRADSSGWTNEKGLEWRRTGWRRITSCAYACGSGSSRGSASISVEIWLNWVRRRRRGRIRIKWEKKKKKKRKRSSLYSIRVLRLFSQGQTCLRLHFNQLRRFFILYQRVFYARLENPSSLNLLV